MKPPILTVHLPGNDFQIHLDDRNELLALEGHSSFDIKYIGGEVYSVIVDGRQYVVHASTDKEASGSVDEGTKVNVWVDGQTLDATVETERTRLIKALEREGARHPAVRKLVAPMPGLVVKLNSEVGQAVQPGSSLLILEAMKMENEIRSAVDGTVESIAVSPGQAVEKGEVLMTFR